VDLDPETRETVTTQVRFYLSRNGLIPDAPTAAEVSAVLPGVCFSVHGALYFKRTRHSKFTGVGRRHKVVGYSWTAELPLTTGKIERKIFFFLQTEEQAALAYDAAHELLGRPGHSPNRQLLGEEVVRLLGEEVEAYVAWRLRKRGLLPPLEVPETKAWFWKDQPQHYRGLTNVERQRPTQPWRASINVLKRQIYLGFYGDREEAALAVHVGHSLLKLPGPIPNAGAREAVPSERRRFVVDKVVKCLRKKGLLPPVPNVHDPRHG
jgi:hypothetical protein